MDILFFAPLTLTHTLFNLILLCFHSYSLAIIGLSLLINLFMNPLYWHCTQLQTQLQTIKLTLTPRLIAIRQAYSGRELGYMKKTLYRQKNYRPSMELKARLWLMIQLPLFLITYLLFNNVTAPTFNLILTLTLYWLTTILFFYGQTKLATSSRPFIHQLNYLLRKLTHLKIYPKIIKPSLNYLLPKLEGLELKQYYQHSMLCLLLLIWVFNPLIIYYSSTANLALNPYVLLGDNFSSGLFLILSAYYIYQFSSTKLKQGLVIILLLSVFITLCLQWINPFYYFNQATSLSVILSNLTTQVSWIYLFLGMFFLLLLNQAFVFIIKHSLTRRILLQGLKLINASLVICIMTFLWNNNLFNPHLTFNHPSLTQDTHYQILI